MQKATSAFLPCMTFNRNTSHQVVCPPGGMAASEFIMVMSVKVWKARATFLIKSIGITSLVLLWNAFEPVSAPLGPIQTRTRIPWGSTKIKFLQRIAFLQLALFGNQMVHLDPDIYTYITVSGAKITIRDAWVPKLAHKNDVFFWCIWFFSKIPI